MHSSRVSFCSVVVFAIVVGACKESTAPPQPASVAASAGVVAEGTAGTILTTPPTFVVKDASGNSLSGISVTVAISGGAGTLLDAPTSTKSGATSVGSWKLANVAGINSVTVTVSGLTPLVISVNGKAGPTASLAFVTGAGQSARAGTLLAINPVAQVRDQFGNGIIGAPVTFLISEGDGTVSSAAVSTDALGNAPAPPWTLGRSAVPQSLRAQTPGGFAAILPATISSDYSVDLRFFGPPMPPVTAAMFSAAAARIRAAVVGDVPNVAAFVPAVNLEQGCGVPGLPTAFGEAIDDVIIFASVGPIDGAGKILAFSGPCGIRGNSGSTGRQTFLGVMEFDSDDIETLIARGNLTDVIQHEMLHVVGIGTLWNLYGVLAGAGTSQTRFTGALGVGGCIPAGGSVICADGIPVENTGGPGTADSHWRESIFGNEIMTGFVTNPTPGQTGILNPLSVMSIQSLGDVGYVVNAGAADPYTIPGQSAARFPGIQAKPDLGVWEQVMRPKLQVSAAGRISVIPQIAK